MRGRSRRPRHAHTLPPLGQAPCLDEYVLTMTTNGEIAHRTCCSLAAKYGKFEGGELVTAIPAVEKVLYDHRAALSAAKGVAGATLDSIMEVLTTDVSISKGPAEHDRKSSASENTSEPPEFGTPPAEAISTALRSATFKSFVTAFTASSITTRDGRLGAFAKAFEGSCMLSVRVACSKSVRGDSLAQRDPALAALSDLRVHRVEYFNFCFRVDLATGTERVLLRNYFLAAPDGSSSLLDSLLDFQPHTTDLLSPPSGYLSYKQALDGRPSPLRIDKADHYCIPEIVDELGEWLQRFYSAIGYRRVVDESVGFSVEGFCSYFAKHLRLATRLATRDEQLTWLSNSVMQFKAALMIIGTLTRSIIGSSAIATASLASIQFTYPNGTTMTVARPAIEKSSAPVVELERMKASLDTMTSLRQDWSLFSPSSSSAAPHDSTRLPRLSEATRKRSVDKVHGDAEGKVPGSRAHTARLTLAGDLLVSNSRFSLEQAAQMTGRSPDCNVCCWPFLLARCGETSRCMYCPFWGQPGHESDNSSAHVLAISPITLGNAIGAPVRRSDTEFGTLPVTASAQSAWLSGKGRGGRPLRPPMSGRGKGRFPGKGGGKPPAAKGIGKGIAKGQKGKGGRKGAGMPTSPGRGNQRGRGGGGRGAGRSRTAFAAGDQEWEESEYEPYFPDDSLADVASYGDDVPALWQDPVTWNAWGAVFEGREEGWDEEWGGVTNEDEEYGNEYGNQPSWYSPYLPEGEEPVVPDPFSQYGEGWGASGYPPSHVPSGSSALGGPSSSAQWPIFDGEQGNGQPPRA